MANLNIATLNTTTWGNANANPLTAVTSLLSNFNPNDVAANQSLQALVQQLLGQLPTDDSQTQGTTQQNANSQVANTGIGASDAQALQALVEQLLAQLSPTGNNQTQQTQARPTNQTGANDRPDNHANQSVNDRPNSNQIANNRPNNNIGLGNQSAVAVSYSNNGQVTMRSGNTNATYSNAFLQEKYTEFKNSNQFPSQSSRDLVTTPWGYQGSGSILRAFNNYMLKQYPQGGGISTNTTTTTTGNTNTTSTNSNATTTATSNIGYQYSNGHATLSKGGSSATYTSVFLQEAWTNFKKSDQYPKTASGEVKFTEWGYAAASNRLDAFYNQLLTTYPQGGGSLEIAPPRMPLPTNIKIPTTVPSTETTANQNVTQNANAPLNWAANANTNMGW